jgi:Spy/CpxP family protein refolding chaperone
MTKAVIAALLLAATTSFAFAAEDQSLSGKEMKDGATVQGGSTDMPKAKPDDHSLSGKEMKDGATTMGGSTDMPNAKPADGSLQGKEMTDHPGAQK